MALAAYRHLLRSTRIAFQGSLFPPFLSDSHVTIVTNISLLAKGDAHLLHAARVEARNGFRKNLTMQEGDPALGSAIAHAEQVAKILRENVVQGKKVEGDEDRYSEFSFENSWEWGFD
jgi:complex III assembly factor LYRM7